MHSSLFETFLFNFAAISSTVSTSNAWGDNNDNQYCSS